MQFSCAQCSTRYAVPDDKVRGKRIRTKCRKCGAEIVVNGLSLGTAPQPARAAAAPAASAPHRPTPHAGTAAPARVEEPWTVAISRTDQRKMVTAEVVEAYAAGTITDATLVWKQGMQKWQAPFEIPAIALALLARGLEPKPPPPADQRAKTEPPPPASTPASDWDDEATRVFDAAVVSEDFVPSRVPAPAPKVPAPKTPAPSIPAPAPVPKIAAPKASASPAPARPPQSAKGTESAASEWDDEDEATKMLAPDRALLGARLPRAPAAPKPGAMKSRAPPVPPRRSAAPARPSKSPIASVPPPPAPLAPTPTKSIGPTEKAGPTQRPPPGAVVEDPFAFEDEPTAVITADRARELLDEQLEKPPAPSAGETPMSFGGSAPSPVATTAFAKEPPKEPIAVPRARRESVGSYDDLVEKGPTIVVAETEKRRSSRPPPPKSPTPPAAPAPTPSGRPSARDFGGIQYERTRVVRAVKKPGGRVFWIALVVALTAAAVAGYYASRLLDPSSHPSSPERP